MESLVPDVPVKGDVLRWARDERALTLAQAAELLAVEQEYLEKPHLLLGNTGISDENRKDSVERFCNQFAAFFLMPRKKFVSEAAGRRPPEGQDWSDEAIRAIARRFKTSMSSVAIHLEDVGLATPGLYDRKLVEWEKREKKKGIAVATHEAKIANKLGVRHVDTVLHALDAGVIDQLDANELLFDTKPKYFASLRREIEERKLLYGRDRGA
jgi:IrrE N-terminal-like domain